MAAIRKYPDIFEVIGIANPEDFRTLEILKQKSAILLNIDLRKVALSTALCILYASQGQRDNYCAAIAGVLLKHTKWSEEEINKFIHNNLSPLLTIPYHLQAFHPERTLHRKMDNSLLYKIVLP